MAAFRKRQDEPPPTIKNWTPLAAFMTDEGLVVDDLARLLDLGITPRMQTVGLSVWVHRPTIPDWRELARLHGFQKLWDPLAARTGGAPNVP
jgi:hypothetical protein